MQAPCPICQQPSTYSFSSRDLMFNHQERYDYQCCTACHFIFQHPLPSLEKIATFYLRYCVQPDTILKVLLIYMATSKTRY